MILLMRNTVWQIVAQSLQAMKMTFGLSSLVTYIRDVAANCVNAQPRGYIEIYPSPPLGPGRHTIGSFFLLAQDLCLLPSNLSMNVAAFSRVQITKDVPDV